MSKLAIKAGTTSKLIDIFVPDSSSTTGAGLTGLVYNSAGLTCYYKREGQSSWTAVTLATMTQGTWASGGFIVADATHCPGVYEVGVPDAAIAASAKSVKFYFQGATNMAPVLVELELTAVDNQDSVRYGMTALPNAAAEAAGGLYTRGTGAGQINQDANGRIDTNTKTWIGGTIPAVNVTGVPKVDLVDWLGSAPDALSSGKIPADVKLWLTTAPATVTTNGYVKTALLRWLTDDAGGTPDVLSSGKIAADLKLWLATAPLALSAQQVQAIVTAYATGQAPLQPTTAGRTLDVSATGEAGVDWANVGAPTTTNNLSGTTVAAVSGAVGSVTGAVGSVTGAVGSVTGSVGSVASYGTLIADIWAYTSRTLTSFGTLTTDAATAVWAAATRTLSAFGFTPTVGGYAAGQDPATLVLDVSAASHNTSGTIGAKINSAASASDPWATAIPGSYTEGQAGEILGNLEADIWGSTSRTLTQTAAQIAAVLAGSDLTIQRGDTCTIALTGLGNISARTKLWFTLKLKTNYPDSGALVQVEETAGLIYLNGAAAATPTDASIVVTNATTGAVTITLKAALTAALEGASDDLSYDMQMLTATSVVTLTAAKAAVTEDVTRATS